MFELHIANKNYSSWSLRAWILMKQLDIPFIEKQHTFLGKDTKTAFQKFSPSATVPCLVDGDITVWDSLAIVEYLAESFPVWPNDKKARAFGRSAVAEMHSSFKQLRTQCPMSCGIRVELGITDMLLNADLERIGEIWKKGLTSFGGPYLLGQTFSAADAFFCPVAFRLQTFGLQLEPTSMQYVDRLLQMPHMQQWYQEALKETSRDEMDDLAALAHGKLLIDYRSKVDS